MTVQNSKWANAKVILKLNIFTFCIVIFHFDIFIFNLIKCPFARTSRNHFR